MASTTPFPLPPGLEPGLDAVPVASEVKSEALEAIEEKIKMLSPNASRDTIISAIRDAVLSEVERKVQEKTEDLWAKGKQVLGQMQQKHNEKTQQLIDEVAQCQQRQQALTAENERLKQVLQGLAARCSMLSTGGYFCKDPTLSPDGSAQSTVAGASPPQTEGYTPSPFTPGPFTPGGDFDGHLGQATLPDVPAFPFPASTGTVSSSVPPASPAPLSLAEALGTSTPQRTPLSLATSLGAATSPEVPSPFTTNGWAGGGLAGGHGIFSFTLRKADGAELGLNVSHDDGDKVLFVEGVRPDGAVDAWNRQCASSTNPEKAVMLGDKIICINSVTYDPVKMLEECRDRQLLKLTIARGNVALPPSPTQASAVPPAKPRTASELRADASVFVPQVPLLEASSLPGDSKEFADKADETS